MSSLTPIIFTQASLTTAFSWMETYCSMSLKAPEAYAAAMDARFVKDKLEQMLGGGAKVFLDSDNLQDLRLLLDHVRSSEVLVLFQACPQAPPLA